MTGTDYTATGLPTKVTFNAESSSGSATGLMIDPEDDDIDECTKGTIVINGSRPPPSRSSPSRSPASEPAPQPPAVPELQPAGSMT